MNTLSFFSVYDGAAHRYLDPFVAPTPEVAIRGFKSVVNKAGHPFNEYPADYTLFHVGNFDAESGVIESLVPHSLGNGMQYIEVDIASLRNSIAIVDDNQDGE